MLTLAYAVACAFFLPTAPVYHHAAASSVLAPGLAAPRAGAHPLMQAPPAVYSPSKDIARKGEKYYKRGKEMSSAIQQAMRDVGKRKIAVITGASSGLGLYAMKSLLEDYEGYYVIAAVRDPAKMEEAAEKQGISPNDYKAIKFEGASLQSTKDFAEDLKKILPWGRGLDRLICNAAVYLPTDPKPRFTDDGYEMSFGVNHLSHFLLLQLLLPELKKAKGARVCIVGSVTGNKNTVAGSLVKPVADVGDFSGMATGPGFTMVNGKKFDGAKAYKDAKALNMMTVLEAHNRLSKSTGIVFNSMYPGCIAQTQLFREKRDWFRYFFFPTLMKAIGSYVSQKEAGQRLAQVIADPVAAKSGVYWSWNGDASSIGVGNAGGAGGEIFENDFSGMIREEANCKQNWDLSMKLVKKFL